MPGNLTDPGFVRLGEALQRRYRFRGRWRRTTATLTCAVPLLRDRAAGLADLPRLAVTCSATQAGDRMAGKYSGSRHGVPRRLAVSVLPLPEEPADYLRGRSRQAVRTNSRRARQAGVTCRRVDPAEAEVRVGALLRSRGEPELLPGIRTDLAAGLVQAWVASDAADATEVVALTSVDRELARLDLMLSSGPGADAARYLLWTHLVDELAAAGARHVAVDTALWLGAGLRHFQGLLGFAPMTLEISRAGSGAPASSPAGVGARRREGVHERP